MKKPIFLEKRVAIDSGILSNDWMMFSRLSSSSSTWKAQLLLWKVFLGESFREILES
jgi:hypothetical protein